MTQHHVDYNLLSWNIAKQCFVQSSHCTLGIQAYTLCTADWIIQAAQAAILDIWQSREGC